MTTSAGSPSTFLHGSRTSWADAPPEVVGWVETRLGAPVRIWDDRVGGMSTGIASVVSDGLGRSLFVKAVNGTANAFAYDLAVRETELSGRLPPLPRVPRVLDAGEVRARKDVWWLMMTPAAPGHAVRHPWRPADLTSVLRAWDEVAVILRATPWERRTRTAPFFTAWSAVAADPNDPWQPLVTAWLDREARLIEVSAGSEHDPPVLSHFDLRADNILITDPAVDDDIRFVDWAHPGLAARWVDLALLLADVVGSGADASTGGSIDVVDVWRKHPLCSQYDPELLVCVVAGLAAALHLLARRSDDPLLPHRRRWAAAMVEQLTPFVRRHTAAVC
jgi:hypothetical protein